MGNRLGLRGNELLCFAVIYGFSQDGESQFKGNLNYLSECMFCSQPTTLLCISKLLKLDLIRKEEAVVNGKKRCYYSTTVTFDNGELVYIEDEQDTTKESLVMTTKETLVVTTKESLPVTTKESLVKNTNIDNKYINNKKSTNVDKKVSGDLAYLNYMKEHYPYVMKMDKPLTQEQAKKLKVDYGEEVVLDVLEAMNNHKRLLRDYRSAYKTAINWCERRAVDRRAI